MRTAGERALPLGEDGAGVAAGDRAGERAVAVAQGVVQRGGQERATGTRNLHFIAIDS